jgi:HEAT repeat protein
MPPELGTLISIRSRLVDQVIQYLERVAEETATMPAYYSLTGPTAEKLESSFGAIEQNPRLVEYRTTPDVREAVEQERARAAGLEGEVASHLTSGHTAGADGTSGPRPGRPGPLPPVAYWNFTGEPLYRRAVILGDAGFGKTWLLRAEARHLAALAAKGLRAQAVGLDKVPFPVLAGLNQLTQTADPIEDHLSNLAAGVLGREATTSFSKFVRWKLGTRECVVLLDGWDEVPVEQPADGQPVGYQRGYRQELGRRLHEFIKRFQEPTILLTSRLAGYRPVPDWGLSEVTLLGFSEAQVRRFVGAWFDGRPKVAADFLRALTDNAPARGMSRVPLLLSLMCRAFADDARVVSRRAVLYDRCLRGLLRDWRQDREAREINLPRLEAMLAVLRATSGTLAAAREEGFSEPAVVEAVRSHLRDLKPADELYGRPASSVVDELERCGVLIRVVTGGDRRILFLHRTFHEYLVARHLAHRVERDGWGGTAQLIDRAAWLPSRQESIVLLAALLPDPVPLLELLADRRTDDAFRHRLAVAASCLSEVSTPVGPRLTRVVSRITTDVIELVRRRLRNGTTEAIPHLTRILPVVAQVNGPIWGTSLSARCWRLLGYPGPALLGWLASRLESADLGVVDEACGLIRRMGSSAATPRIVALLARILGNSQDGWPERAAYALGGLDQRAADPAVLAGLERLLDDGSSSVKRQAVEAIRQVAGVDVVPGLLPRLFRLLAGEFTRNSSYPVLLTGGYGVRDFPDQVAAYYNSDLRKEVLTSLGELQRSGTIALPESEIEAVRERNGPVATAFAVSDLALEIGFDQVGPHLVNMLGHQDWKVRYAVLQVLGAMGSALPESVQRRMVDLLRDSVSIGTVAGLDFRMAAAAALGGMDRRALPADIPDILDRLFDDPEPGVRLVAAESLGELGAGVRVPRLVAAFGALLVGKDYPALLEASRVLERLGKSGVVDDQFANLVELLNDPSLESTQVAAAVLKGGVQRPALGPHLPRLRELFTGSRQQTRSAVVRVIGHLGGRVEPADCRHLARMVKDGTQDDRRAALFAIEQLGRIVVDHCPDLVPSLLGLTESRESEVRSCAVETLGALGTAVTDRQTTTSLCRLLGDRDLTVRAAAVRAVGRLGEQAATAPVVAYLGWLLGDSSSDARADARMEMRLMSGSLTRQEMIRWMAQPRHASVQRAVVQLVADLGAAAATPAVLTRLVRMLERPVTFIERDGWARGESAKALSRMMLRGVRLFSRRSIWLVTRQWVGRTVEELAR